MVLAAAGNVDMASAPALADHVGRVLRRRPATFITDFTDVRFLATAGMSILMEADRRSQEVLTSFRVVAAGKVTARPMQLLGIDGLLDMYPTVAAALRGSQDRRVQYCCSTLFFSHTIGADC